jgi:hypothetical protein
MMRRRLVSPVIALAAGALFAGCERDADSGPVAGRHTTRLGSAAQVASTDVDLVSAVSAAGTADPVSLKFRMPQPPRVGQPARIELVLAQQPGLDIDSLLVSLQPGDGLAVESEHTFEFQSPPPGATQRMAVTVRAGQAGLLNLGATVLIGTANASLTRSFSVPLIVAP